MDATWILWRTLDGMGREVIETASLSDGLTEAITINESFRAVMITARDGRSPVVFPFDRVVQASLAR